MRPHHRSAVALVPVMALLAATIAGCSEGSADSGSVSDDAATPAAPATPAPAPREPSTPSPLATLSIDPQQATRNLVDAVRADDVTAARSAISAGASLKERGKEGRTPPVEATKNKHVEMALMLLEAGADPDAKDEIQDSAFLYAGAEGFTEILRATLEHGADVSSTNRFGGTALIPAAEHAHLQVIDLLIAAGTPLDHMNDLGWTALHEAIVLGSGGLAHQRTVTKLLEAGADPALPDGNGTSPRDLAAAKGYRKIVAIIDAYLP